MKSEKILLAAFIALSMMACNRNLGCSQYEMCADYSRWAPARTYVMVESIEKIRIDGKQCHVDRVSDVYVNWNIDMAERQTTISYKYDEASAEGQLERHRDPMYVPANDDGRRSCASEKHTIVFRENVVRCDP